MKTLWELKNHSKRCATIIARWSFNDLVAKKNNYRQTVYSLVSPTHPHLTSRMIWHTLSTRSDFMKLMKLFFFLCKCDVSSRMNIWKSLIISSLQSYRLNVLLISLLSEKLEYLIVFSLLFRMVYSYLKAHQMAFYILGGELKLWTEITFWWLICLTC